MKIVCDDKIPFLRGVFEPFAKVSYLPGGQIDAHTVREADALIVRTRTRCDEGLLEKSRVKIVATATIGYDHIDTLWCEAHGIRWVNAPGCNAGSVRQYVGSALALLAKIYTLDLSNMTLGIIGLGHVGSRVASLASAIGMKVLVNDPPLQRNFPEGDSAREQFVPLSFLLSQSDLVTLHTPLLRTGADATLHLIQKEALQQMKRGSFLINTSRGEVVCAEDLKHFLRSGHIRDAALDVWENEPAIDQDLQNRLAIATPHIAGYSIDGKAGGTLRVVEAVAEALDLPVPGSVVSALPAPEQPLEFLLHGRGKSDCQIACEAFLYTYPLMDDVRALREDPEAFETLRGNYPVRREFEAFTIHLHEGSKSSCHMLRRLGFSVMLHP